MSRSAEFQTGAGVKVHPNKFAGHCVNCGGAVPAGQGILGPKVEGRWTTQHLGGCPPPVYVPPAEPTRIARPVKLDAPLQKPLAGRSNKFGGHCVHCNAWVAPGAGTLMSKDLAGQWGVKHNTDAECFQAHPVRFPDMRDHEVGCAVGSGLACDCGKESGRVR